MKIAVLVLLLALVLAGCGGGSEPEAGTTPQATEAAGAGQATAAAAATAVPAATESAQVQETPQAAATTAATVAPEATEPAQPAPAEEDELDVTDREDALQNLDSYRATWSFAWTGKKDGQDQTVRFVMTQEYTSEPPTSRIEMESNDSLAPDQAGTFEMYQIGDQSYLVTVQEDERQCTSFSSADNPPTQNLASPSMFGSIRGGQFVGTETVNGIEAKHYRYDETATGLTTFTKLSGDAWVAVDGGYVVKDTAEWEGSFLGAMTGDATEPGNGSWTWELSDVNESFEITAPEGCESAAAGLPIMADASEQASMGDFITYKSQSKLADVARFYVAEMPKAGWTAEGEATITEEMGSLMFVKDGQQATVVLTPAGDTTTVMISVEK